MKIRNIARIVRNSKLYEVVVSSSLYYHLHCLSDSASLLLGRLVYSPVDPAHRRGHIILAPTGGGNIGDQALLEAAIKALKGDITIVGTSAESLTVPYNDRERVSFHPASGFIYLPPFLRFGYALRLVRLISSANTLSVVGADLMDGAYNPGASLARSSALWLAAKQRIPSVLLGCSWASASVGSCAKALSRAGQAGAQLNFRDGISQERAVSEGMTTATLTSDIVFSDDSADEKHLLTSFCTSARQSGRRIALVNASGLVAKRMSQTGEYVTIVDHLLKNNFSVVLLPHVFRATGDDLEECKKILGMLPSGEVRLVDSMLRPSAVRSLCQDADLVITGRMHLAVMALGQGVVPITLGTHGKVEGLYRHFQGLDFCVEPKVGFGRQIADLVPAAMEQSPGWKASLPSVTALSEMNFRLLTTPASLSQK